MKVPLMLTGNKEASAYLCIVKSGKGNETGVAAYVKDTKNNIISKVLFTLFDEDIKEMLK